MKYFFPMLCVVAAGGAGYVFEPKITPNLISDIKVKERITEVPIDDKGEKLAPVKEPALPKVDPLPAPEPPPVAKVDPVPPAPVPAPAPEPPPVAKVDPAPMPDPPAADPAPVPEPQPEPPATAAGATLNEDEIVKVMQESIKGGKVNEFKFEQVLAWKAGSEETVDGTKYQTGEAAYKAETIFGVKTMQAKALIKDGKVAKWVWKTSGMEIK